MGVDVWMTLFCKINNSNFEIYALYFIMDHNLYKDY